MTLIARPCTASKGFDCAAKLLPSEAKTLWDLGYQLVGRYLPLPNNSARFDLDAVELKMLTDIGFEVSAVQHVRGHHGWDPAQHSGAADADAALAQAQLAGIPLGTHLYLDLEDIGGSATATKYFAEDWATAVRAAGYRAGLYVGFDVPLDPVELWMLHGIDSYWTDPNNRRVLKRGCAIHQGRMIHVGSLEIDEDAIAPDSLGELPYVVAALPDDVA